MAEQQQVAEGAVPPLAADAPPMCDEIGCGKDATHAYTWDWGMSGVVCAEHAALLSQRAANLNRTVSVHPLQRSAPVPMQRDERIRLNAEIGVLKAELQETKDRGLELYQENVKLSKQVQVLNLRDREAQAQMKDAQAAFAELQAKLDASHQEQAEMADELSRLRTLAKFVDDTKAQGSVIDGPH